jgi:hypothetical protein
MVGTTVVMWINGGNNNCIDVDQWWEQQLYGCGSMVGTTTIMMWINVGNNNRNEIWINGENNHNDANQCWEQP